MQTQLLPANEAGIAFAARLLQEGQTVAIPTETVYGLAADATSNEAVAKIFAAKGRPQDNPLIVHIAAMQELEGLVRTVPAAAYKLAQAFWPGPLTIIMPKGPKVADAVCAGLDTVAIRMPSHPVAAAVIKKSGLPLAAPSANRSGLPSPTTADHTLRDMDGRIPLILDGGACKVGVESTVITVAADTPTLLRPGYITKEQLEQVLGEPVALSDAILHKLKEGEAAPSPGMKYKHYSPKANVILLKGSQQAYREYVCQHAEVGVFAMCYDEEVSSLPVPCVVCGSRQDEAAQARRLFAALRECDEKGAVTVYAHCPKPTGVGMAVYNRLIRAAAFQVVELEAAKL
ncbi:MAG: threonylcarbamoyl-AMP synthase [Pygmaiobacter massiliensis]|nr:threonylcarbamoyl-AMP synthase [Pygmaiobacter massiliensis]